MCFECGPEKEMAEDEYFDGSGEASSHPTDEPGSFWAAKSLEDAKIAIEYPINVDYQTVSLRRDLVLHEGKFIGILDPFVCQRFFEAPLVVGSLIKGGRTGSGHLIVVIAQPA